MISPSSHPDHIESLEEHVYLNVSIKGDAGNFRTASYVETRPQPIISKGSDFQLAITRFTVPWGILPLSIFRVQENQSNRDLGIYSFTLTFDGSVYTVDVIYEPDNLAADLPLVPTDNGGKQDVLGVYYYIYTLKRIAYLFNNALQTAFNDLKAVHGASAPQTEAPFFIVRDDKLSLVTQTVYNDALDPIEVWCNSPVLKFVDGIDFEIAGFSGDQVAKFILYEDPAFDNGYSAYGVTPTNPPEYIRQDQFVSTIPQWSEVKKIIFNTSLIPVRQENIASTSTQGEEIIQPILTDFDTSGWDGSREPIKFSVGSPYRYIDILSSQPIRSFDISVFWQDSEDEVRPVLAFSQAVEVKIAFIRKHLVS